MCIYTHLELHGCVFLILWRGVALVVQVIGRGGMDDCRLLRLLVEALAVNVHEERQQARAQETGHTCGYKVQQSEPYRQGRKEKVRSLSFSRIQC